MASSIVAVVRAASYDAPVVEGALAEALGLLGIDSLGGESILADGATVDGATVDGATPQSGPADGGPASTARRVLLKPNLLIPAAPDRAVTTHPAVFGAVARWLTRLGEPLSYGDSPSFELSPGGAARRSGIAQEAESLGVTVADFQRGAEVHWPHGLVHRRFHLALGALEARALVNLPKLKTHGLTTMTGALKNLFGLVPGFRKKEYHVTHPDREGFSRMIADLAALVRPRLVVMDAISAMEGNGPSGGTPVALGLLIVSTDPVAVDAVACRIAGIDASAVPVLAMAEAAGAGVASLDRIEVRGLALPGAGRAGTTIGRPFALPPRTPTAGVPSFLMRAGKRLLVPRPYIREDACRRCGTCVQACPVRPPALSNGGRDEVPRFTYGRCIRCYCCQEVCPHGAVVIRLPALARVLPRA